MEFVKEQRLIEFLREDPSLVLLIKEDVMSRRVWERCIKWQPELFMYAPIELNDLALSAVKGYWGNIFVCIDKNIPITEEIFYSALKGNPKLILQLESEFLTEDNMGLACELDNSLIGELPLSEEFILNMIRRNPYIIRYISNPNDKQVTMAIRECPNSDIILCIQNKTKKVKRLYKKKFGDKK